MAEPWGWMSLVYQTPAQCARGLAKKVEKVFLGFLGGASTFCLAFFEPKGFCGARGLVRSVYEPLVRARDVWEMLPMWKCCQFQCCQWPMGRACGRGGPLGMFLMWKCGSVEICRCGNMEMEWGRKVETSLPRLVFACGDDACRKNARQRNGFLYKSRQLTLLDIAAFDDDLEPHARFG